jgi:hypothetical protein
MKVGFKKKTESFYILGYLLEPTIKTWQILGQFFPGKILSIGQTLNPKSNI